MTLEFPTLKQTVDRTRSDVRAQLPDVDPTIFGSFVRALADAVAVRQ